jgi:hypothetical protein
VFLHPFLTPLSTSDYAKFDEIVHMSYLYSQPRVQDWPALHTWQVRN